MALLIFRLASGIGGNERNRWDRVSGRLREPGSPSPSLGIRDHSSSLAASADQWVGFVGSWVSAIAEFVCPLVGAPGNRPLSLWRQSQPWCP